MRKISIEGITVLVGENVNEAATISANLIMGVVFKRPEAVINYATGNTQIPVYQKIAEAVEKKQIDFSKTIAIHLDEYFPCGTDPEKYPYGFVYYLRKWVWGPLRISKVFEFNGLADNPEDEAIRYDRLLSEYPRDLTILGLGPWSEEKQNGCHIAFCESGTPFDRRVHVVSLNPITVTRDRQERGQDSPDRALTQGLANIMESKMIILNAWGEEKAKPVFETLRGAVGVERPSTVLRTQPEKVIMVLDEAAAGLLG